MIRVVVTGAKGQLGTSIQHRAAAYPDLHFHYTDKTQLDITDPRSIRNFFSKNDFEYCINCAAYTQVEEAERNPDMALLVNAEGVKNLALACKRDGIVLFHISTDYVFDGKKEKGYLPSDSPNPINKYGQSKLKGEQYIEEILKNYLIIRTSWLYSEHGKNFYNTILEKARKGEDLKVTDAQVGCPTNAGNLAEFILSLITNRNWKPGIIHFTDGKPMSWFDFAVSIVKSHNLDQEIEIVRDRNYRSFAQRPEYSILLE
ncbi:dTDP-4-dehydrorhamnose reductase [Muriicola soli]|uniref:dTDP-4-dehydrorhamnose reductase n=1 Tax=Muriicola soli TaxID=2507538 RepID=A0A411ECB4_9FLAO|nr:dTDP-4-dehydrorhamnose reductase [Muriicola soli]QBA65395.1 dTDP-4-dehydrorhamnose reductase [Muriicola soli]